MTSDGVLVLLAALFFTIVVSYVAVQAGHMIYNRINDRREKKGLPRLEPSDPDSHLKATGEAYVRSLKLSAFRRPRPAPSNGIFISYRRTDEPSFAFRLYDLLCKEFGPEQVFIDARSMELGLDFVKQINLSLDKCKAVVVVIGRDWLGISQTDERSRIKLDGDYVRLEVATALDRDVRVIPVLVAGTPMPNEGQLPPPLQRLTTRSGIEVSHDRFDQDVKPLVAALKSAVKA